MSVTRTIILTLFVFSQVFAGCTSIEAPGIHNVPSQTGVVYGLGLTLEPNSFARANLSRGYETMREWLRGPAHDQWVDCRSAQESDTATMETTILSDLASRGFVLEAVQLWLFYSCDHNVDADVRVEFRTAVAEGRVIERFNELHGQATDILEETAAQLAAVDIGGPADAEFRAILEYKLGWHYESISYNDWWLDDWADGNGTDLADTAYLQVLYALAVVKDTVGFALKTYPWHGDCVVDDREAFDEFEDLVALWAINDGEEWVSATPPKAQRMHDRAHWLRDLGSGQAATTIYHHVASWEVSALEADSGHLPSLAEAQWLVDQYLARETSQISAKLLLKATSPLPLADAPWAMPIADWEGGDYVDIALKAKSLGGLPREGVKLVCPQIQPV